jgi:glutamate decarboxylase
LFGQAVALHILKPGPAPELDEAYASAALGKALPRRMPERGMLPFEAYQAVHDELGLDGNARLNLATFCQTWIEPQVHELMNECIDKNIIDKDEYPQTAEVEARCVHILADLWHAPETAHRIGTSTTGSSEAAMLGGLALKRRWQARMQAAGKSTGKPNLVCGPVQICWHKFARYFDVEMRQVPLDNGRLTLTPDEAVERCDENTIAVVATLGVTYTLQYEPVEAIALALDELQRRSGLDVPMHIDAASGGFLAPFLTPELRWDFRLARVRSINASGHKFGLSPLGCGWVVWRTLEDLPEELIFRVNYLGGDMPTFALNFSRPGGQIVAQYYNFVRLGREGYTRIQRSCAETAAWLSDQIAAAGPFTMIHDGRSGIPGCTWALRESAGVPYNLFDLADKLRSRGWLVPAYSMPANVTSLVVQRVLVKNGFSRDMASLLLRDLQRAMAQLAMHPPGRSLTESEMGCFKHT